MRRLLVAGLVLAALHGASVAQAEDDAARPAAGTHLDLECDRKAHDFGAAGQHEQLETSFTIRNSSDHAIEALHAGAECGCNHVKLSRTSLEPGETSTLVVGFQTGTLSGPQTKRIRVWTGDGRRGRLVIPISISVITGLIVHPGAVAFHDVAHGSLPTSHFDVIWHEKLGKPFDVTSVQVPGHEFEVSVERYPSEKDDPWRGHRVHLTFKSPPPLGVYSAEVLVKTDHPGQERFKLPLSANVVGRVWLQTRTIHFGVIPEGTSRQASIRLRPRDEGVDLGAVAATSATGHLVAEVRKDERHDGTWILTVTVPDTTAPGRLDDEKVVLETQVPGEERIEIQVRGRVRAGRHG